MINLYSVIDTFSKQSCSVLETVLKNYRDSCKSDDEFSKRMKIIQEPNQPENVVQYYFDGLPVFYSQVNFDNLKITYKIKIGHYKDAK